MSYSIMHGKRIYFQKSKFFTRGHYPCPASDHRAPGRRAVRPVEAAVPCMELDPAKRAAQGHDLPGTFAGSGTKGRHPSSPQEKDSSQSFPAPKPAGKDGGRPNPCRGAFAGAFSDLNSPSEKKPFGETVQQPHR